MKTSTQRWHDEFDDEPLLQELDGTLPWHLSAAANDLTFHHSIDPDINHETVILHLQISNCHPILALSTPLLWHQVQINEHISS